MFDLALHGSGFAAFVLADEALKRGQSVVVVERGSATDLAANLARSIVAGRREPIRSAGFDFDAPDLKAYRNVPRFVGLGGSSALWSGKWRPLDGIDFRRRVGDRSWPIAQTELLPSYAAVRDLFGLVPLPAEAIREPSAMLATAGLRLVPILQEQAPTRLAQRWSDWMTTGRLTVHADARDLHLHVANGAVTDATIRTLDGQIVEIAARHHVIAAGGIDSPCLVETFIRAGGAAPRHVAGGHMDHPKGEVGRLLPRRNPDLLDALLDPPGGCHLALGLPEDELAQTGLPNHSVFLWGQTARQFGLKRLLRRRSIRLIVNVDQDPEEENGIGLADGDVTWRISGTCRRSLDQFLALLLPRIERLFGPILRPDGIALRGSSHPAGAAPMSAAPRPGQLDSDLRLAGLDNVFCASSAAFPIAGSANPTMTIAALAHRLAGTLNAPTGAGHVR